MIYLKFLILGLSIFPLFHLIYFKDGLTSLGFYNYIDEYILIFVALIIGITIFFLKTKVLKIFVIYIISMLFCFFCFEVYLLSKFQKKKENGDTNEVLLYPEYLKKKDKGIKGAHVPPIYFLNNSKSKNYLPLSNLSNTLLIVCNENNYYSIIKTDRFGFNNPNTEWDKKKFNFIFLGDSFTDGYCVNEKQSIPGNFRKKGFKGGIINLGVGGSGPLLEYATLKEYFPDKKVDIVYWIYYHGNDLADLNTEMRNNILKKYYYEENFKQNLKNKKKEVEKIVNNQLNKNMQLYKTISINKKKHFQFKNLVKLTYSRKFFRNIIDNYINLNPPKEFLKILEKSENYLKKKNTKLIFVYLPKNNNIKSNPKFVKSIKKLGIEVIDLGEKLENYDNKRALFPISGIHHFSEFGYKIVSELILKNSEINY